MTKETNYDKKINLMNDALFKAFFRSKEAREVVSTFLSSVTGIEKEKFMKAKYVGGEIPKKKMYEKGKTSDVIVLIDDHKRIIVEANNSESKFLFCKNASYGFSNLLELIEPNMTVYPYVLIINLDGNNEFKTKEPILDFKIRDENGHIETEIYHSIHLVLENIVNCKYNIDKEIKRFAEFLKTTNMKELKERYKESDIYMSAVRKIEDLTRDPELAGQYDIEEAREREKFECHLTGLEEGIEEGIEQGEKNKQIEIAKTMLKDNMSLETISKYTGLTIEEMKEIGK